MSLKKPLLLGTTLIVSSLLLSACIPGLTKKSDTTTQSETKSVEGSTAQQMLAGLQSGQSLKCNVTNTTDNQTFTYYLKDKKFRMDGTTTVDGQAQTTHAINDSIYVYTWTDSQNQGVKMKVPTAEELAQQADQYKDYLDKNPDLTDADVVKQYEDSGYTIKCDPAGVDDGLFVPPTTVQFQDLSAMMENATKLMKDAPAGQMTPEQLEAYKNAMDKKPE